MLAYNCQAAAAHGEAQGIRPCEAAQVRRSRVIPDRLCLVGTWPMCLGGRAATSSFCSLELLSEGGKGARRSSFAPSLGAVHNTRRSDSHRSRSAIKTGPTADESSPTPAHQAAAPGRLDALWQPPERDYGSPITGFQLEAALAPPRGRPDAEAAWSPAYSGSATFCQVGFVTCKIMK